MWKSTTSFYHFSGSILLLVCRLYTIHTDKMGFYPLYFANALISISNVPLATDFCSLTLYDIDILVFYPFYTLWQYIMFVYCICTGSIYCILYRVLVKPRYRWLFPSRHLLFYFYFMVFTLFLFFSLSLSFIFSLRCSENVFSIPLVIKAHDIDAGLNSQLHYDIVEMMPRRYFHIDSTTGAIKTVMLLDHEKIPLFTFHVKVNIIVLSPNMYYGRFSSRTTMFTSFVR